MKTRPTRPKRNGFTLIELLLAMVITSIIVGVLVSITGIAIDTWNRSRQELRTARQAKAMLDLMANDFESMVTRSGDAAEWLAAVSEIPDGGSVNAAKMVFFTASTDRYEGQVGVSGTDDGGDVSCVGYMLQWKDPINSSGSQPVENFVLNRLLVDPKPTFTTLLGKTGKVGPPVDPTLDKLFTDLYNSEFVKDKYFVCENIFQFTVAFHVEVPTATGGIENKLVSTQANAPGKQEFRIKGSGLETLPIDATLTNGRVTAVEISMTVLTDTGVNLLRAKSALADDGQWVSKNGYHYSKLVKLPRM